MKNWLAPALLGCLLLALPAAASETAPTKADDAPRSGPPPGRGPLLAAGFLHGFRAPIDGGGEFSTSTGMAAAQIGAPIGGGFILGAQGAWQGDWYSFRGENDLVLPSDSRPWADVQSFAISGTLGKRFDNWFVNAVLTARFSFETGASIGDGFNPGGIIGFQYTFSPGLRLGAGVLVNARLEEDPLIIPIPYVHWEIVEGLVLSNSITPDAYPRGPGIELAWRPVEALSLAVGGRWEFRRFRLNDSGPAIRDGGVGEDEGVPLWLRATWRLGTRLRADFLAGASVANRLRLADSEGRVLRSIGTDSIPMLGVFLSHRW